MAKLFAFISITFFIGGFLGETYFESTTKLRLRDASKKAESWILNQRNKDGSSRWGNQVTRIAVVLHLVNSSYFTKESEVGNEVRYEVEIQLLNRMLRKSFDPMSANELALYIQALLVTCINPRDFYGLNLVQELQQLVYRQSEYMNPFVLLTLCNAGELLRRNDFSKLNEIFRMNKRILWTDIQAFAVMALTCARAPDSFLTRQLATKHYTQSRLGGMIENLKTTALVTQTLIASGITPIQVVIEYLLSKQEADGSFGNFMDTYYVLPVMRDKTFLDINAVHCSLHKPLKMGNISLAEQELKLGPKIHVRYYLWLGDKVNLARSLDLAVLENSTFFEVMRTAAAVDATYRFEYSIEALSNANDIPYVYKLADVQDDPEQEKFWFLYKEDKTREALNIIERSPAQVIANKNDIFVMWYRTGHWNNPEVKMLQRFSSEFENTEGSGEI